MKTSKHYLFVIVAILVAAFSFSSCINNDDDNTPATLDKDTQRSCQMMMSGTHGSMVRMYYAKSNGYNTVAEKYDSLEHASWSVKSDSTITLGAFPINKLDSALYVPANDNTTTGKQVKAIQEAISAISTPIALRAVYFIPYNNSQYITGDGYQFLVIPNVIKQEVTYEGGQHTLYFVFYEGTLGSWKKLKMNFEYNMLLGGIAVDQFNAMTGQGNFISNSYFREVLLECKYE